MFELRQKHSHKEDITKRVKYEIPEAEKIPPFSDSTNRPAKYN